MLICPSLQMHFVRLAPLSCLSGLSCLSSFSYLAHIALFIHLYQTNQID